jgi:hypothetical protein
MFGGTKNGRFTQLRFTQLRFAQLRFAQLRFVIFPVPLCRCLFFPFPLPDPFFVGRPEFAAL